MAGYTSTANRVLPVVSRDFYGTAPGGAVTAPNLKRATFTSAARTAIALEFDQPMSWSNFSRPNYYVDDVGGKVTSGSVSGNIVTLQLNSAAAANATLDFLKDANWNLGESVSSLLFGANGIPALTFADVPVQTAETDYSLWAAQWPSADLTNPGADFDGDGLSNNEERIWGLDPTRAASRNPFSSLTGLPDGTFSYTRRVPSLTGLRYTVWTSTNLITWTEDPGAVQTPGAALVEVETVSSTVSPALVTRPQLYLQIRASRP
jgi:hypothetical protein